MKKVKATFYLPLYDNDGRFLEDERLAVEDELYRHFTGWTFLGYFAGMYRMADGSQALDESAAYSVMLDGDRLSELEDILQRFLNGTLQEAIYFEVQRDIDIRFIRKESI